jgi:hypothetical protein
MGMVVRGCFDLKFSTKSHPDRDGAWLHSKWKVLKSKLSVYHVYFMCSGNQDAENLVDEWCTFL